MAVGKINGQSKLSRKINKNQFHPTPFWKTNNLFYSLDLICIAHSNLSFLLCLHGSDLALTQIRVPVVEEALHFVENELVGLVLVILSLPIREIRDLRLIHSSTLLLIVRCNVLVEPFVADGAIALLNLNLLFPLPFRLYNFLCASS
jgi:hypothetical protein